MGGQVPYVAPGACRITYNSMKERKKRNLARRAIAMHEAAD